MTTPETDPQATPLVCACGSVCVEVWIPAPDYAHPSMIDWHAWCCERCHREYDLHGQPITPQRWGVDADPVVDAL